MRSCYAGSKNSFELNHRRGGLMNLKIRLIILAGLLALLTALLWPALPARSTQASPVDQMSGPSEGEVSAIEEQLLVVTNGMIIDGTGSEPIANGGVVIQGNHIVAVGPASALAIPAGAEVIDVGGGTIMPGLINAHVHNTQEPGTRYRFLTQGVTSTCDLASSSADMPLFEQALTQQNQRAARGFHSGPMLTAPGGYPTNYGFKWDYEVATSNEARAAVRDLLSLGADMIKVALEPWQPQDPWPVLNLEQVQAIVQTAHSAGVPVRAHVQQAAVLDLALQAGVDSVEHVPLPFSEELKVSQMSPEERLSLADFPELEAQLSRMAAQRTALVPTLSVGICATRELVGHPKIEARRRMCEFQLEIVGRFHELGGIVALGNDYGNPGVAPGMPLQEMKLLLEAGLSPLEVIQAGTRYAAQVCGHGDELGTLESGKLADLIIVESNPLLEVDAMSRVSLVIKDGEIIKK
jgi:imidazolonepropionase-like amidohydrolase